MNQSHNFGNALNYANLKRILSTEEKIMKEESGVINE